MSGSEAESAWNAFVQAEQVYRDALGRLRDFDMRSMLGEALLRLDWRRQALTVIGISDWHVAEALLPELLPLSCVSHSLLGEVRRCILRIPRDALLPAMDEHVTSLITNPESDYEAYRRTAELLRLLKAGSLMGELVEAADQSPDPDIREVAEDFRGEVQGTA
ncbi:hypothetical protein [Streptomyces sp. NPDC053431]|uniref:hypothetical protein n=1 Tax=Streptomyces sp. NPDC053431 TaxID=3365703 RepID=UPI0037D667D5